MTPLLLDDSRSNYWDSYLTPNFKHCLHIKDIVLARCWNVVFMNSCINETIIVSAVFHSVFVCCAAGALVPSLNPGALRDDQN